MIIMISFFNIVIERIFRFMSHTYLFAFMSGEDPGRAVRLGGEKDFCLLSALFIFCACARARGCFANPWHGIGDIFDYFRTAKLRWGQKNENPKGCPSFGGNVRDRPPANPEQTAPVRLERRSPGRFADSSQIVYLGPKPLIYIKPFTTRAAYRRSTAIRYVVAVFIGSTLLRNYRHDDPWW